MRLHSLSLVTGLIISGSFACSDKDNPATGVDAGSTFKGYNANEGGEIRVEYVRFMNGGAGARVVAFLYKDPGSTKYFPFPNLNGCTDMTSKTNWPEATNPLSQRVYHDPGNVIISNGPSSLTVSRQTAMGADFLGRTHPANDWFFHFDTTDGAQFLTAKSSYDIILTGSADLPGQIFHDVPFMPADFALSTPALTTPVSIKAGTAQTFSWTTPDSSPPTGYEIQSLVAFTGDGGPTDKGPAILCVQPNTGSITVPAPMIDVVRAAYPAGGLMARQTFTHVTRELIDNNGPTGQRIDLISAWCYATPYTVAP